MSKFWNYLSGTVFQPRSTFTHLLDEHRQLIYSIKAVFLIGALYTLTVIGLAIARVPISIPAWIAIPPENYYYWEIFFGIPVFFLGWILAAGLTQLLIKLFKGSGAFESTLAVFGFAMTVPMFVTWIVETLLMALTLTGAMQPGDWQDITAHPGFWQVFGLGYQFVAIVWYLVLIPIATSVAHNLRLWQATLVGILIIAIVGFVMFIFIR